MRVHLRHPRLDRLAELGVESAGTDREKIARHVRACPRCQDDRRFLRRVERAAPEVLKAGPPSDVLERALKSRAAGERIIVPAQTTELARPRDVLRPLLIAAGLLAVIAMAVFSSRKEISAAESESTLVITPGSPKPGDRISVEYRPAVVAFSRSTRLTLRGRLHTVRSQPYSRESVVKYLSTLSRDPDGIFRGSFALPDSVVYIALAVEDTSASTVDTRDGRLWDVLVYDTDDKPGVDALTQRENDLMGRSWEEAYATATLNTQLHPQSLAAWSDLQFFEKELLGDSVADSLSRTRVARLSEITNRYKSASRVPAGELATLVWWSYIDHDTSALRYWYDRLVVVDPHHPQVAQIAAAQLSHRYWTTAPRMLLDSLEILWSRVGPVYGPGTFIISMGQQIARRLGDGPAYRRWVDRSSGKDSLARTGIELAGFAPTRGEGIDRIRMALGSPDAALEDDRPLNLNRREYERRLADRRRELLGSLGEALIAAKQRRSGLDTLTLAISDGWNLELLKRVAAQRMATGDTTGALQVEAKISVDPRTQPAHVDSVTRLAVLRIGPAKWSDARTAAQQQMVRETMSRSLVRSIRGDPSATSDVEENESVKKLIEGKASVLVYWSRHCGPALEALPAIDSVGRSLRSKGTPVYLIVDEPRSPDTEKFFRQHKIGVPVLYDSRKQVSTALRNFGTPAYYVTDNKGLIRFDRVGEVNDLVLQIAAIQSSAANGQ